MPQRRNNLVQDLLLSAVLLAALTFPVKSLADGEKIEAEIERPSEQEQKATEQHSRPTPGEERVTPQGKKIRLWSTEGGVPVSDAPEPFPNDKITDPNIIVDVDTRDRIRRRKAE